MSSLFLNKDTPISKEHAKTKRLVELGSKNLVTCRTINKLKKRLP